MNTTLEHKSQTANQRAQQHESQSAKAYPSRTIVHAKLEMTEPGDHDEREADAMARAIVSGGKIARKISGGSSSSSGIAVSQQMESQLSQLQGGGRPMPEGLRNMMESGFGQDFSHVRLHTDSEAADMNSSIHAKAFTLGNDIYFNHGQFSPETTEGQRLVAHELTHVVQGTGKVGRIPINGWEFGYGETSSTRSRESGSNTFNNLSNIYNELKNHGILFAINDEVYEFSSQFLKAANDYKKEGKLSKDTITWIENLEKKVGKLNKLSHGFVILNKALSFFQACELINNATHIVSKNASTYDRLNYTIDASLFIIGTIGGVPGAIFTVGMQEFREYVNKGIDNNTKELKNGVIHQFYPGSSSSILDFHFNPMEYIRNGWLPF